MSQPLPSIAELREFTQASLRSIRADHRRSLNPTPYKVSLTDKLFHYLHDLWMQTQPVGELF